MGGRRRGFGNLDAPKLGGAPTDLLRAVKTPQSLAMEGVASRGGGGGEKQSAAQDNDHAQPKTQEHCGAALQCLGNLTPGAMDILTALSQKDLNCLGLM